MKSPSAGRQHSVSFVEERSVDGGQWDRTAMLPSDQLLVDNEENAPRVPLLGCCLRVPLMECARFVGWLYTVPLLFSLMLLPFAASLLDLLPELLLLGTELICVLSLFFGLQHHQPDYLRPFLVFGLLWNLVLLLLLLFCLIELLVARDRFSIQVLLTLHTLVHGGEEMAQEDGTGMELGQQPEQVHTSPLALCLSISLVALLAVAILVNGWLLNIVLLAYLHMKKAQQRFFHLASRWEGECAEMRQNLLTPKRQKTAQPKSLHQRQYQSMESTRRH